MDAKSLPNKALAPRPLSPHIGIYRWKLHMAISILHRITGCALAISAPIIAVWLWAAAYDAQMLATITDCFKTLLGQLVLFGWSFAFYLHMGNGIRHLFWDSGRGFALGTVTKSGLAVIVFALVMTASTWIWAYSRLSELQGGVAL